MATARQLLPLTSSTSCSSGWRPPHVIPSSHAMFSASSGLWKKFPKASLHKVPFASITTVTPRAVGGSNDGIVPSDDDGVSLGTMKLPTNTDIPRFEALLFQWANSLCQGANLPLPVPLKVDKVKGGARLGFIELDDGKTEVSVYIDCLIFPATPVSGPVFRAIRNGPLKDKSPPGEPRIMRSLLQALQKSVEIATV